MSWNPPPGGQGAPPVHTPPPVPPMPGDPNAGPQTQGWPGATQTPGSGMPFVPLKVQSPRGGSGAVIAVIGLGVAAVIAGVVIFVLAGRGDAPAVPSTAAASTAAEAAATVPSTAAGVTLPPVAETVGGGTVTITAPATTLETPPTTLETAPTTLAPTTTLAPPTTAAPVDYLLGDPTPVVAATIAQFGDNVSILEVVLYPDYAVTTLLDPANPEHVDRWILLNGTYGNMQPVNVSGELSPSQLYNLGDIAWEAIPGLAADAVTRLAIEEGAVSHIIVTSDLPFSDQIVIRIYVTSERDSGYVEWTADGTQVIDEIVS